MQPGLELLNSSGWSQTGSPPASASKAGLTGDVTTLGFTACTVNQDHRQLPGPSVYSTGEALSSWLHCTEPISLPHEPERPSRIRVLVTRKIPVTHKTGWLTSGVWWIVSPLEWISLGHLSTPFLPFILGTLDRYCHLEYWLSHLKKEKYMATDNIEKAVARNLRGAREQGRAVLEVSLHFCISF